MALALRDDLGDIAGLATTLDNLGKIYIRLNRFDQALDCFFQALQYNQQTGDKRSTAIALNSIGELLIKKKDFQAALGYFYKGISIANELGLRQDSRIMYANMIMSYAAIHQFDSVQVYFAHYNSTSDSTWYLKANEGSDNTLLTNEREEEEESELGYWFYLIYGLLLLFVAVMVWAMAKRRFTQKAEVNES